jgi:hypothetical protein
MKRPVFLFGFNQKFIQFGYRAEAFMLLPSPAHIIKLLVADYSISSGFYSLLRIFVLYLPSVPTSYSKAHFVVSDAMKSLLDSK